MRTRLTILAAALVALAVFVGCAGETRPATNLGPTSATINAVIACDSDNSGEWWFELAYDPGNTTNFQFSQVRSQHDFDCPPDEDPNTAGYQCSSGVCKDPNPADPHIPAYENLTAVNAGLQECKGYVYRLRARVNTGGGGTYYFTGSTGLVNDAVYDEIPWNRAGSNCPNGRQ
jgi:hypothetical protein